MGTPTIDDSSRYRIYQKFPFKPIFQFFGQTNFAGVSVLPWL